MKELALEEIKERALKILIYVHDLCEENHLRYSIYYGTLLGAVRHGGYIPWDDDIDIVMPRNDYDSLINILKNREDYLLLDYQTREHCRYTFAKVVDKETRAKSSQYFGSEDPNFGVFIDIFPLDGVPVNASERLSFWKECETYRLNMLDTLQCSYARSYSLMKGLVKLIARYPRHQKLLSQGNDHFWRERYEDIARRYKFDESKYCGFLETMNNDWGLFPVQWFDEFELINFEGAQVRTISAKKAFLETRYGNYMELPPEKDRITHHPYKFYLK